MQCKLCFQYNNIAFRLRSKEGVEQNVEFILEKHLHFCFMGQFKCKPSDSICENCWRCVKEFDEFCLRIERGYQCLTNRASGDFNFVTVKIEEDDLAAEVDIKTELEHDGVRSSSAHEMGKTTSEQNILVNSERTGKRDNKARLDFESFAKSGGSKRRPMPRKRSKRNQQNIYDEGEQNLDLNWSVDPEPKSKRSKNNRKPTKKLVNANAESMQFVCELCGVVCNNRNAYKYHKDSVHAKIVYECDICGARLRSKLCIKSHMKKRHMAGEEEPCHICGKVVKYKRMHFLYHQEDYKTRYKCSECGKGFATKTKLKEHSGIHSGILHHKCPFCDETFRFGSSVSIHKKKWHSDRL